MTGCRHVRNETIAKQPSHRFKIVFKRSLPPFVLLLSALLVSVSCDVADSADTLQLRKLRTLKNDFAITGLAWHPDNRHLAVGQVLNQRIAIWDTHTGNLVRTLKKESGGVRTLAYSPDGKYLAVGREFANRTPDRAHVHLYNAATGDLIHRFVPPPTLPGGGSNDAYALAFSPDSRFLAAVGYGSTRAVAVYDIHSREVHERSPDVPRGAGSIESLAFSPDGRFLAIGRNLGALEVWSTAPWKRIQNLQGQSGGVRALAFSPDGKYLASGTDIGERWDRSAKPARQMFGNFNDDIILWSVPAFQKASEYPSYRKRAATIESLQFSPNGKLLLISARSKSLEIVDLSDGKAALFQENFSSIVEAALSPDGKHLALGLGRGIEIHQLIPR